MCVCVYVKHVEIECHLPSFICLHDRDQFATGARRIPAWLFRQSLTHFYCNVIVTCAQITFSITQDGVLSVTWRVPEDEHDLCGDYGVAGHDTEDPPMQTKQLVLLCSFALVLALMYLVLRLGVLGIDDPTLADSLTHATEAAAESTVESIASNVLKPEL
jgi:hypothetical protein